MKTATHCLARRLVMTLLVLLMTMPSWAQLKGDGTSDSPYLINNKEDWMDFTNNINKGVGTTSYYKLTSDLSLGTAKEPLNTIVGTDNKFFRGNFDGDFHTINIIMNRTEKYAALFGVTDGATICNLKVTGTITTTNKFAGGFIAYANNKSGKATNLINCISSIHIICDGIETVLSHKPYDCTHGGLVGQNETGVLNFENCIFDGWIKDFSEEKRANKCTGFVAWVNNTVNYTNCTMAGVIDVKPNDDDLKNSMANFHRLANSAKANFKGTSYYIIDYTYKGMAEQGTQASTEAAENTICKVYSVDRAKYYVPGAEINEKEITYYGWKLTEGTDYIINKVSTCDENKLVTIGINEYGGSYSEDVDPTCSISVNVWDDSKKIGWQAISSPVFDQKFENVNHLATSSRHNIYRYNEEKRQWQEYRNTANEFDGFVNGSGYIYRTEDASATLGFNGTETKGDIKYTLSYTEKEDGFNGINLIGNPYNHVIYKGVSIANDNLKDGYCVMTAEGTWSFRNDNVAIPVGTAVLVQALKEGTLNIKDTDAAPSAKSDDNRISFTLKSNKFEDVACINFKEGEGFNKMAHYNEAAPMLYVNYNGEKFASANISDDVNIVSLAFEAKEMGKYTVRFNAEGSFDYLHLIDRMTGEDIDMLIEDEYSFIGSSNDNTDRFIVKLAYDADASAGVDNYSFAWQYGKNIIVNGNGELQIFDMTGRMVMTATINGAETLSVTENGIYIFRLIGNEVKTQKIVVR